MCVSTLVVADCSARVLPSLSLSGSVSHSSSSRAQLCVSEKSHLLLWHTVLSHGRNCMDMGWRYWCFRWQWWDFPLGRQTASPSTVGNLYTQLHRLNWEVSCYALGKGVSKLLGSDGQSPLFLGTEGSIILLMYLNAVAHSENNYIVNPRNKWPALFFFLSLHKQIWAHPIHKELEVH